MTNEYKFDAVRWLRNNAQVAANYENNAMAIYLTECADEIQRLRAELAALVEAAVHLYNSGYHAGHHDTVEGCYVDIHPCDMGTYHAEEVVELLAALVGEE